MKQLVLLVASLIVFWAGTACNSSEQPTNSETTTTTTDDNASANSEDNAVNTDIATPPTVPANTSSPITDAIVQRVCDCQNKAKQADGTYDNAQIATCMGAESSIAFVKDLLGSGASEKERADAENELRERTMKQCPR